MERYHISIAEAVEALKNEQDKPFAVLIKNGSMSIEYFAPKDIDTQQPHKQDEIYVIASGSSQFFRNGEVIECNKGDVLFVPANMEHHFMNFTDDFATWVIFYGAYGDELKE
ncbi:MAG TPA: cupin domain-containing protein [Chitinophagaceae bacterium]|nr:cupin domain-containing protein [Chitinophagaceae bacterium]